ncbi:MULTISPECIES: e9imm peptide [unclassified Streptomyces]|uniref:e9imm peptide n=1 Tax=unclassified Streptomyces TaxID=2593676 RepID=UPI002E2BB203|nr:e9imm peptide [Streptomyces sp. NBC_00223]
MGRIIAADYVDDEPSGRLDRLGGALACPAGHLGDPIFWPKGPAPSAEEVVEQAMAYRPTAL